MPMNCGKCARAKRAKRLACFAMLVVQIAAAEASADELSLSASVLQRVVAIRQRYTERVVAAQRAANPAAVDDALGERDKLLAELLREFPGAEVPDLSAADLQALGESAELLRRPDDCGRYCRLAIARGAEPDRAYLPWLRSVIAADRLEEAERDLAVALPNVRADSFVHQMHLFLSLKYHVNERNSEKARPHIEAYFEWAARNVDLAPAVPFTLGLHGEHYVAVHAALGDRARGTAGLKDIQQSCTAPRAARLAAGGQLAKLDPLAGMLLYANCELSHLGNPDDFGLSVRRWLAYLSRVEPAGWTSAEFLQETGRFSQYAVANSCVPKGDAEALADDLAALAKSL